MDRGPNFGPRLLGKDKGLEAHIGRLNNPHLRSVAELTKFIKLLR